MIFREVPIERLSVAEASLLDPFDISSRTISDVLAKINEHRVDDADLYFQTSHQEGWGIDNGVINAGSFRIDQGVGVRAVCGEKVAFAYSQELSPSALMDAATTVRTIAAAGQSRRIKVGHNPRMLPAHSLYSTSNPITQLGSDEKVSLLRKVDKLARRRDPRVAQVQASLGIHYEVVLIVRADGTKIADLRPLVRLKVGVVAESNGRREMGSGGGGGRFGVARLDDSLIAQYVDDAVNAALNNLESRPTPAGEMTVVLGPGWPGVLLHEAVGHGLEGDFNRKGFSAFSGHIGQRVAAKGVTVLDDGTLPLQRGSLNIDDEGTPTRRSILIEDGVLRGYIHNQQSARLMGVHSTGNGRRQSYAHLPLPRMTNTFMDSGKVDPGEILAGMDRGIYATKFDSGQVDITSGKFVFTAIEAFWVEKGRIHFPLTDATFIGDGPSILKRVSMIGNDCRFDSGGAVCGKEGQSLPVSVGQPTLRIERITVGGAA